MKTGKVSIVSAFLVLSFFGLAIASLCSGSTGIGFEQLKDFLFAQNVDETVRLVFVEIRFSRLIAGILTGGALALAGAGMQSLFRNPLADPSITGVSAGSALGAVLAITFFSSVIALEIGALVAGLVAAVVVCAIGRIDSKVSALSTLLGGIAVNAFCGAIVGFFMYSVRDAGMRGFVFWTLGSLDRCGWSEIIFSSCLVIPAGIAMLYLSKPLNVMLLGKQQAFHVGVNVERVRIAVIASAAIMTAASVAICGVIGFAGLVVPHILRLLIGPDNRKLMPLSALAGACLLMFADVASRSFSQTDPVPIGVITALIGAPFFVALLRMKGVSDD